MLILNAVRSEITDLLNSLRGGLSQVSPAVVDHSHLCGRKFSDLGRSSHQGKKGSDKGKWKSYPAGIHHHCAHLLWGGEPLLESRSEHIGGE